MANRPCRYKTIHIVMIVLACVCLVVVACPSSWLGRELSTVIVLAQLLAFPYILGVGILVTSVAIILAHLSWTRGPLALASIVMWAVVALAFFVFPYGLVPHPATPPTAKQQRVLSVVTFNAGSTLTETGFQQINSNFEPDVLVLPETSAAEISRTLDVTGYDGTVFETPGVGFTQTYNGLIAPTTVVVSNKLGKVRPTIGPETSFGTVAIRFDDAALPIVVGVHTAPPLPGLMGAWEEDLERVVHFGDSSEEPMLIAGDFNATLRHGALANRSRLIDAQELCSRWGMGTWDSRTPGILRTPIDHILVTSGIYVSSCQVAQIGRSDHLAFGAQIIVP